MGPAGGERTGLFRVLGPLGDRSLTATDMVSESENRDTRGETDPFGRHGPRPFGNYARSGQCYLPVRSGGHDRVYDGQSSTTSVTTAREGAR